MHKILVIRLYFLLDALHVSDYISPSSAYNSIYQMRCTAHNVAPDDGLIQSETCRASNRKTKSNYKNFVHLVGSYTYCRMMHGAYNVIFILFPIFQSSRLQTGNGRINVLNGMVASILDLLCEWNIDLSVSLSIYMQKVITFT